MTSPLALFLPTLTPGGAERVMLTLAGEFAAAGRPVDLVVTNTGGALRNRVPSDVRLIDLGSQRTLASLPALVRYLRERRPGALLSAMDHANLVALGAHRLARVPMRLVLSVHSLPSQNLGHSPLLRDRLVLGLIRRFYRAAPCLVGVSREVARELETLFGVAQDRIRAIPNPVVTRDLESLSRGPCPHPWLESGGPPVVLGVGRLSAEKDFDTLIGAFDLLAKERPARLILLGEGPERGALELRVRSLGIQSRVELPGYSDNPYPWMRCAALLVLSSRWEGLGNVLIESMACGTSVVSTRCPGGPAEILEEGRHGELVPVGDPPALAAAMQRALDHPRSPEALRQRAADFSAPVAAEHYLGLLDSGN